MEKESFQQVAEEEAPGLFKEFWLFLAYNKKWWLLPILVVIGVLGVLALVSNSSIAPFIYTLF